MRGLWERRGARFRGGVLTEATTRLRGGGRRLLRGDVPGWQRRAVADDNPRALLRLCEGTKMVRRGGNEEEDGRGWHSLIEEDGGEGGSKSAIPGGRFRW
jgi:hypothetical protein